MHVACDGFATALHTDSATAGTHNARLEPEAAVKEQCMADVQVVSVGSITALHKDDTPHVGV